MPACASCVIRRTPPRHSCDGDHSFDLDRATEIDRVLGPLDVGWNVERLFEQCCCVGESDAVAVRAIETYAQPGLRLSCFANELIGHSEQLGLGPQSLLNLGRENPARV